MKKLFHLHKHFWSQNKYRWNTVLSLVLLFISFIVNYFANVYTMSHASNHVTDLILDHLPVMDVDFLFLEGFVMLWVFIAALVIREPEKLPFVVKSIALFILIRSAFITLTHLSVPLDHIQIDPYRFILDVTSGNDLFFSSHTGLPFLMALIFWNNKTLKLVFLSATIFFAAVVLLGHLHYSIDVFGALFITYTIFHIAQKIFPHDYKLVLNKSYN